MFRLPPPAFNLVLALVFMAALTGTGFGGARSSHAQATAPFQACDVPADAEAGTPVAPKLTGLGPSLTGRATRVLADAGIKTVACGHISGSAIEVKVQSIPQNRVAIAIAALSDAVEQSLSSIPDLGSKPLRISFYEIVAPVGVRGKDCRSDDFNIRDTVFSRTLILAFPATVNRCTETLPGKSDLIFPSLSFNGVQLKKNL